MLNYKSKEENGNACCDPCNRRDQEGHSRFDKTSFQKQVYLVFFNEWFMVDYSSKVKKIKP
jgi:hypothetical protein